MPTTALLVTTSNLVEALLSAALEHAGLGTRAIGSTDQADAVLDALGERHCVVVLEAGALREERGRDAWESFLRRRRAVPTVLVSLGEASASVRQEFRGKRRILLEDPFDAATVVSAARRVSAEGPVKVTRPRAAARSSG